MVADTVWHSFYNLPPLLKDEDGLVLDEDELRAAAGMGRDVRAVSSGAGKYLHERTVSLTPNQTERLKKAHTR